MHARVAHVALETAGILEGLGYEAVGRVQLLAELGHILIAVLEIGLEGLAVGTVGHALGHEIGQAVALGQRKLLHTGHILDGRLGGHGAEGDDVRHLLLAIAVGDIAQHLGASVVVKVDVYIG